MCKLIAKITKGEETMERKLKDHIRDYYFQQNYNCAEAIIHAANDYYQLGLHEKDMIMVAGFGAGMQVGNTCGAIISSISVLSLLFVEKRAHESKDITVTSAKLMRRFKEKYNSTLCKDIKPQSFQKEIRCLNTIDTACDILEEVIDEYKSEF
jgi:C_GCAxxG_C_C family probable redox protein